MPVNVSGESSDTKSVQKSTLRATIVEGGDISDNDVSLELLGLAQGCLSPTAVVITLVSRAYCRPRYADAQISPLI